MKKLLLLFSLLFIYTNLNAQLPFTAKEGVKKALEVAADDTFTDPYITGIGTATMDYSVFSLEYNYESGENIAWLYFLQSDANQGERKNILLIRTALGFINFDLPDNEIPDLPIMPDTKLPDEYMDSDETTAILKKNDNFKKYMDDEDFIVTVAGLTKSSIPTQWTEANKAYWGLMTELGEGVMPCFIENETKECTCFDFIDISVDERYQNIEFSAYPNPASDFIIIKIPFDIQSEDIYLTISDLEGNFMHVQELENYIADTEISLNTNNLSSGEYFITIYTKDFYKTTAFTIVR